MGKVFALIALFLLVVSNLCSAQSDLVQVKQDFSTDPGWEAVNNRVEASDPPTIKQDFGWSEGRIGGTIWQSTTPAWYAMPLGKPLNYDQPFSTSGKIAFVKNS